MPRDFYHKYPPPLPCFGDPPDPVEGARTVGDDKDFSTIQAAIDDIDGDLSVQGVCMVEVSAKAPNNEFAESPNGDTRFSGGDEDNYIHYRSMIPHDGVAGGGIKITGVASHSSFTSMFILDQYSRLEGFEFEYSGAHVGEGFYALIGGVGGTDAHCRFYNLIIHGTKASGGSAFGIYAPSHTLAYNNIIYDLESTYTNAAYSATGMYLRYIGAKAYNNTVYDVRGPNAASGWGIVHHVAGCTSVNNYVGDTKNLDFNFKSSPPTLHTNNISSDDTADDKGSNNLINKAAADQFVNPGTDFHLKADADCLGAGTNLSGTFTDDTDRYIRSAWDVGADEYCA